jgi:hypothetical protein
MAIPIVADIAAFDALTKNDALTSDAMLFRIFQDITRQLFECESSHPEAGTRTHSWQMRYSKPGQLS